MTNKQLDHRNKKPATNRFPKKHNITKNRNTPTPINQISSRMRWNAMGQVHGHLRLTMIKNIARLYTPKQWVLSSGGFLQFIISHFNSKTIDKRSIEDDWGGFDFYPRQFEMIRRLCLTFYLFSVSYFYSGIFRRTK